MMTENIVSLGEGCIIAGSMSKWGMRGWSGPFDWLVTEDFSKVLEYIDSRFNGFLLRVNLNCIDEVKKYYQDVSNGFKYLHDRDIDIDTQFDILKARYERKINRFYENSFNKTIFLRSIRRREEVEYIEKNTHYINDVVKNKLQRK